MPYQRDGDLLPRRFTEALGLGASLGRVQPARAWMARGIVAMIAGAVVGGVLVALTVTIAVIFTPAPYAAAAISVGVFPLAFIGWWVGILCASPFWVLMHLRGLTKPRHAIMAGALLPGLVVLASGVGWLALPFAFAGALVGLTIQRVYYGRLSS